MAHLFVVHGDLMALACDAWCVPGSWGPGRTWERGLPPRSERLPLPRDWADPDRPRACLLADPPAPEPLPFLAEIVADDRHGPDWWVARARDFVRVAAATLRERGRAPSFGRARHLVALPLVGTGGGGANHLSGELVRLYLRALREEAILADVDVALVLLDGAAWAAAQNERRSDESAFDELPAALREAADELAARARAGDLVLFIGAGVSQAAGLPGWADMLVELGEMNERSEREALQRLGELDRAAVIQRRLPAGVTLGAAAARLIGERARRHALGHALLASLPVDEVVTTNYDDLFERASKNLGRPCTVLPGRTASRHQRWVLKMHGDVERPETMVITREDYLKFQENRTALAGIVGALLLTRHMMFIGFSLTDDNFHRIAHAVRQAMGEQRGFGTTLVVNPNPLGRELWSGDLDWIPFDGGAAEQARLLDIFLDRLSCKAATATSHLGEWRYEGALSPGERMLRDRLMALAAGASAEERATGAWAEVARTLERCGIAVPK